MTLRSTCSRDQSKPTKAGHQRVSCKSRPRFLPLRKRSLRKKTRGEKTGVSSEPGRGELTSRVADVELEKTRRGDAEAQGAGAVDEG